MTAQSDGKARLRRDVVLGAGVFGSLRLSQTFAARSKVLILRLSSGRQDLEAANMGSLGERVRFRERSATPLAHPDSSEAADSSGVDGPSVWTTVGGAERSTWARLSASGAREHSISQ